MVLAVWFLTGFGNWIARRAWLPVVVENQRQLFRSSLFVVEHDGEQTRVRLEYVNAGKRG